MNDCCDANALCTLPWGGAGQTMCVLPNNQIGSNVESGCTYGQFNLLEFIFIASVTLSLLMITVVATT